MSALASAAYAYIGVLALSENNATLLLVAVIGATASIAQVFITVRLNRKLNEHAAQRRVVVTKQENGVTVSNEELDELSEDAA